MPIDPTDPETIEEIEELEGLEGNGAVAAPQDVEAPLADAFEQRAEVFTARDEPLVAAGDEVNPADLAEQARVVEQEDEDYR
ncbi:hypothetical protein GCM10027160_53110 [Streptomyces calidiresistens]|uniref:DUF5709 domain-containing protein n=1 Tax=Streptomyces calidiresistens TaxID=1485586 RepID=A0A7W3XXZ8_9ACTN|nr:hypothetical protein [Streptomyces calidiresistens]MBB0231605.1 hypothetical protein [Streptomyces calidiresistens]